MMRIIQLRRCWGHGNVYIVADKIVSVGLGHTEDVKGMAVVLTDGGHEYAVEDSVKDILATLDRLMQ